MGGPNLAASMVATGVVGLRLNYAGRGKEYYFECETFHGISEHIQWL